jgi:hypothetical protein
MRTVFLGECELEAIDHQDSEAESDGGWQDLLAGLRQKVDRATGCLHLDARDLEQIPRYAFDCGNGVWEARLLAAFERVLGPRLGR